MKSFTLRSLYKGQEYDMGVARSMCGENEKYIQNSSGKHENLGYLRIYWKHGYNTTMVLK
jgi:hypothetical protein